MKSKVAYAIGIWILALSVGCAKRLPASSILEEAVADLAAWVPEEMEGLVVVSSLEELQTSFEQLKGRSSLKQLKETLEMFQEETKEEAGLDLFSLSTWQEMGFNIQRPLMASFSKRQERTTLVALPVVDHARFLAAMEKHWISKGAWEAQPGMPQGLHAWHSQSDKCIILAQKPGHALVFLGDDLKALQEMAQLPKEKSWAKHKSALLKMHSRLPANRVVSAWWRINEIDPKLEGVEWIGLSLAMHPRIKMVMDVAWNEGKQTLMPKMQTVSFEPQQWFQDLGEEMLWVWSSVTWDWYTQLLRQHASRELAPEVVEAVDILLKQNFEPPMSIQGRFRAEGGTLEGPEGSVDILLKKGGSVEQFLNAVAPLVPEEKIKTTQPNPDAAIWKVQIGERELMFQTLGQNKVRISESSYQHGNNAPNALQKVVVQEMTSYPIAFVFHLQALMEHSMFRFILGRRPMEKAEYFLVGLRAEEDHVQLIGEHFAEESPR